MVQGSMKLHSSRMLGSACMATTLSARGTAVPYTQSSIC